MFGGGSGAPEIISCLPYNEKVDLYSFSITMLELAISEPRFIKRQFVSVGMPAVAKASTLNAFFEM